MAKSDNLFKDVIYVGAFIFVGYIVLRYILPNLSQALSTAGTGFFGPSSTGQGALPYGISYRSPNGTLQASTSGTLGQLINQLLGKKQQQQSSPSSRGTSGSTGGGGGGGLPFSGLLPPSNGLQELQDWQAAGNSDLSQYFNANPATFDPAYYDSPTLDSIQIPSTPYTPQGIDLSGAAVPFTPPTPGDQGIYSAPGGGTGDFSGGDYSF